MRKSELLTAGAFKTSNALLALVPIRVNARVTTSPHSVEFGLVGSFSLLRS
jgi:hypothetical protein